MAGAGYKLFNTGDVLTAQQVNEYLMQQTVMVFADATARTTALSGIIAEGLISYLKSTDAVEVYNGSTWVSVAGSTFDSYGYTAGKNKIINGDFSINQRGFTSNTADGSYNFDRWLQSNSGGTVTTTPQTFTPGTAPVSGYEGANFVQTITATQSAAGDYAFLSQRIENVRTLAGQSAVVSFWAKAASGTPSVAVEITQNFGSGGSPSAAVNTYTNKVTLSTSWARYSVTVSVPSISGKTIGTTANTSYLALNLWISAGSTYSSRTGTLGVQNGTFQFWGVQFENGSTASAFQTASGSIQGELALCQRYFVKFGDTNQGYGVFGNGIAYGSSNVDCWIVLPVEMRVKPTAITWQNLRTMDWVGYLSISTLTIDTTYNNTKMLVVNAGVTGATTYRPYSIGQDNNSNGFLTASAEL